ncbi:MAG: hypothetical protein JW870_01030 [Candidatus Delongbacteria bacterium]|nr:hypothetical protein [Candidatus Delongbacteria bacterium]
MSYDWNWFFSAFSQCGAAIIGIIGAFVISRILNNNNKFNDLNNDLKKLEITHHDLFKRIKALQIENYIHKVIWSCSYIRSLHDKGKLEINKDTLKLVYLNCPNLYKADSQIIKEINTILENLGSYQNSYNNFRNSSIEFINSTKPKIDDLNFRAENNIQFYNHNRIEFQNLKNDFKSLSLVIIVLLVALYITVIYPLHFLPLEINQFPSLSLNYENLLSHLFSAKGVLLTLFFATFGIILGYLIIISIKKIKKIDNILSDKELIKLSKSESYSEYFLHIGISDDK